MNARRIFGILLLIIGIGSILVSFYIKNRTEEGKTQIADAQKKVQKGDELFSMNPYAKEIGKKTITGPAQKKINAANQEVAKYDQLASWFQIGGIIVLILGAGLTFAGKKSAKPNK